MPILKEIPRVNTNTINRTPVKPTPFPLLLWILILASALTFAVFFVVAQCTYGRFEGQGLTRPGVGTSLLLMQVLATLTEPEGVNVFVKWNAGEYSTRKRLVGLWVICFSDFIHIFSIKLTLSCQHQTSCTVYVF